jgi:Zn-dependent metalloprotease
MCRTPHSGVYKRIVAQPDVQQDIRDAAQMHLYQASFQASVNQAVTHTDEPASGFNAFNCTIYSMNNEDFADQMGKDENGRPVRNWKAVVKLPGILLKDTEGFLAKNTDGGNVTDPCLDLTFTGFQKVYNFYQSVFDRNSVDGNGLELRGAIHLSVGFDNAFWDPDKMSMFFGDGGRFDGKDWLPPDPNVKGASHLTNWHAPYSLDILGHELTHGVVQHTAKLGAKQFDLVYHKHDESQKTALVEAGTLDEHIADCFGIMVAQFSKNEDARSGTWDMAPNWYSDIAKNALGWDKGYVRTFRVPENKARQADLGPKHMDDLVPFVDKNGQQEDPHTNVGIPNHAFYLAAQSFGGQTWTNVGKIWYTALTDEKFQLPENQTFKGFRDLTVAHAELLYAADGKVNVGKAWEQVGL